MEKLWHGNYVHLDVLDTGGLRITLTPGAQEELDSMDDKLDDDWKLRDLMNESEGTGGMEANSGPLFVTDISIVDGGHMSQAPAVYSDWDSAYDENGQRLSGLESHVEYVSPERARVWYWNEYMIISILEHIKRNGEAVLTRL